MNATRLFFHRTFEPAEPLATSHILPDPAACADPIRDTPFAAELVRLAREIVAHRFPIFGQTIETGPDIDWRRDYRHDKTSGTQFFRRVPYLDFEKVGDHKWIWELNRHQHLVVLAQAFLLTGDGDFIAEIEREIESWMAANPFLRGINSCATAERRCH